MAEEESGKAPETPPADVPVEIAELESVSSQAAYDSFIAAARAIDPAAVEECCADLVLTYHNVTRGVEAVLGSGAVVIGKLPSIDVVELSMLPRLVQGVAFAALQVQRELRSISFGTLFDQAQNMRRKLRKSAEALAEANLLSDADADEVRLYGQQDVLEDCLALAAVFRRNESRISGRSPVSPSEVRDAEQIAEKLKVLLGQQGASADGGSPPLVRFLEMRDRFWTLLVQRHDVLWRCGAWLYGRAVDDRVPPLVVRQPMVRRPRNAPAEREAARPEPRRTMGPPAITPARASAPAMAPVRDSARHLNDLQRELERKTRFLVRIGVIPQR
ncbi:hypothetical protein [Hyalangium versicolor]|uniref:hypothetical protein n=1 Tax=Hyalangium versicolor TaxID=2861190 RepID=UPI001CCAD6EF|nr:hypothetical protein [Hyalangium versicolor]